MIKRIKILPYALLLPVMVLVVSCGKKVPGEWQALIGTWDGTEVMVSVEPDGTFNYKEESKTDSIWISTWVTEYSADGFKASTLFGERAFRINRKPFFNQNLKQVQMVMDGRTLTKRKE